MKNVSSNLFSLLMALVTTLVSGCKSEIRGGRRVISNTTSATATPGECDGTQSVPVLRTKKIAGNPGANVALDFDGTNSQLRAVFWDSANIIQASSEPNSSDEVVLPTRAGLYRVALINPCTGKASYAQATVNGTFAGFTASADVISYSYGAFSMWPQGSIAFGDFDSDGDLDMAQAGGNNGGWTNTNGAVVIYLYDSGLNRYDYYSEISDAASPYGVMQVKTGDFNEDGYIDLLYHSNAVDGLRFAAGNNDGSFDAAVTILYPAPVASGTLYAYEMEIADLDRDGHLDVAMAAGIYDGVDWASGNCGHGVMVMKGDGTGNFAGSLVAKFTGVDYPMITLQLADADDDGRLDIYSTTGQGPGSMIRMIQQTDGSFTFSSLGSTYFVDAFSHGGFAWDGITVAYVNSDLKPDVMAVHVDGPSSYLASNASDMTYASIDIASFTEQHGARSTWGDLDLDGEMENYMPLKNRLHYIGPSHDDKAGLFVQKESEIGTFANTTSSNAIAGYSTFFGWSYNSAFFEDFNQDGKIDIVMSIGAEQKLEMLHGN